MLVVDVAKREANGQMAKMQGFVRESSHGNEIANSKDPSRSAKKTQLQDPKFSEKNSSNLLHRSWGLSMDSGRGLLKLPAERAYKAYHVFYHMQRATVQGIFGLTLATISGSLRQIGTTRNE